MVHLRVDILDAEDGPAKGFFQVCDYPFGNIRLAGLGQDGLCSEREVRRALIKSWKSQTQKKQSDEAPVLRRRAVLFEAFHDPMFHQGNLCGRE
jgi:hypothetical protein